MAITVPGSGSSATTSVTIPTHAVEDMIVIMARGTVAPTAPAAGGTVPTWITPTNQSGVNNSQGWRLGYAIATATTHTSGTWTNAAQMHVLVLRPTSGNTLAAGNDPTGVGGNNVQVINYPAFTLTASKVSNLVIRYGARGTADTEVRTDGAFASGGTWHTEQPATTPTSAVFTKVVTASEAQFQATPAGANAAYRAHALEITEQAAAVNHTQPVNDTIAGVDAQAKGVTALQADVGAGVDVTANAVTSPQADAIAGTDSVDTELAAAPFSPADIAGLYAWYDADQLGLANNDPVSSFTDESGGGRHLTGAATPLYKTGIQNGLPGVLFDGTDDTLTTTIAADATRTIFVVAKAVAIAGTVLSGNSNNARLVTGAGTWTWNTNQSAANVNLGGTPTNTTVTSLVVSSTSSMSGYLDSGSATAFDPNDVVTTVTTLRTGASVAGSSFWNGYIFEVVVYDTALGTTDRESVRDYLLDKWIPAAVGHSQPVDDAAAGTDAQAKAVTSPKADALAVADAFAKQGTTAQADTATVTDAVAVRVTPAAKADTAAATDASSKAATKAQADSATVTDASTRQGSAAKADTGSLTDAVAKRVTTAKADTGTLTDSVTPLLVVVHTQPVADPASVTDASTKGVTSAKADSAAGTDALAKALASARSDTAAITDARTGAVGKGAADTASVTDAISISYTAPGVQTLADSPSVTDSVAIAVTHPIADPITATDSQSAGVARAQADAVAGTDSVATDHVVVVAHTLTLGDAFAGTDALATVSPPAPRSIRLVWASRALLIEHTSAAPIVARSSASPIVPQSSAAPLTLRTTASPIAEAEHDAAPVERTSTSPLPEREMEPV